MNRTLGGVLLVAGTAIGAAMLALPVSTGMAGFLPATLLFIVFWALLTYTSFLILEVNLWMKDGANMVTMAYRTLGMVGQVFAWCTYIFLLYTLTTAYLAVGGPVFLEGLTVVMGVSLPAWVGPLPLLLLFSATISQGTVAVDRMNRVLMLGLGVTFILLLVSLGPHGDPYRLTQMDWPLLLVGVSAVATSFGFHVIIPSLTHYLHRDTKKLVRVLFIGSTIPLFVYVIWEALTLSIIPVEGSHGLKQGFIAGVNGASLAAEAVGFPAVILVARLFLFFAIVTSFLGVSLSLLDCLSDGLGIKKEGRGKLILYLLTFGPPLIFALTNVRPFLTAIEYAGAFGVVTLLGLLPALMVWSGRYWTNMSSPGDFKVVGGRPALIFVMLCSLTVIIIELCNKLGLIDVSSLLEKF